ncbi:MAG: DUF3794 domain-containing protein [Eubacterium sp.]|jgi:hypothetical protein|nr:DUF3794 domain-containing protein [Eubacterium sp.]
MELNVSKEPVYLCEVLYDGQTEQGVEFDYVLPDYYPDIFKILKCTLTHCVVSYSVSGSQLFCDGVVYIKVLYLSAKSNSIQCIEQRYTYSKTIDLPKSVDNASVSMKPKTDYCNCRAVSGRRIDVRGAVSCKVKVIANKETEMITDAKGLGVETKNSTLSYCGKKLFTSHQFVSREDIETGADKEGVTSIVHHDVCVQVTDYKVIANKVVVKGEALIKALYTNSKDGNDDAVEVMEAVIPINQIVDLDGITDEYLCYIVMRVMDCDLEVRPADVGDTRIFACNLTVECNIAAHLEKKVSPLSDLYSTHYETGFNVSTIKTETMPKILSEQLNWKSTVECTEGTLEAIYDTRCELVNVTCRPRGDSELILSGQANIQVIGKLNSGAPVVIEKTEPFEITIRAENLSGEHTVEHLLQIIHINFSITTDNRVDIRINMLLNACLYKICSIDVVSDISVHEDKPKVISKDYALKLYFAESGEEVWGIAKRYNTSASAIMSENDLDSEKVLSPIMLLIPIV